MQHPTTPSVRLLIFTSIATVLLCLCVLCQFRLMPFGHLGPISVTVISYPLFCLVLDMVSEIYGYRVSRQILWIAFIGVSICCGLLLLFMSLPAPPDLSGRTQDFDHVFILLPRQYLVNTIGVISGVYCNIYLFGRLRKWLGNQQFSVRSIGSTFLGDFVTTVIGLGGEYFHQQPLNTHLLTMTFGELLASYILASLITPPASLLVRYLKSIEPDVNISVVFNPFK